MGNSEDDAVHKIPHKMKMHCQNQLKLVVGYTGAMFQKA